MQGLMMDTQLLITSILRFAEKNSPSAEIVSVTHDHALFRYTYSEAFARPESSQMPLWHWVLMRLPATEWAP